MQNEIYDTNWKDWKWQQRHVLRDYEQIVESFRLSAEEAKLLKANILKRRVLLTPYLVKLLQETLAKGESTQFLKQYLPIWDVSLDSYDGSTENWELREEMVTPICQHKYSNRVIIRMTNHCHSYCQFCYEALRTLENKSNKEAINSKHWHATLDYLKIRSDIDEAILSGGEPLMLSDHLLDQYMNDLRSCRPDIVIRLHTRSLTFNPFRINEDLGAILKKHRTGAIGLHICHPSELTPEFDKAASILQDSSPILFANIPLLKSTNDDPETLKNLCLSLYRRGIIPHYLYHFHPYSPGEEVFKTSIRTGVELINSLKRRVSNFAVPEFVIPHESGKYTVPLDLFEEWRRPELAFDENNRPILKYKNWKNVNSIYKSH